MKIILEVLGLICFGVFTCTFMVFLAKTASALTGLDLAIWAGLSGGMLWGTYFFAKTASWEKKKDSQ